MEFGTFLIYFSTFFGIYTALFFLLTIFEKRHELKKGEAKTLPRVTICVPCYNEEFTVVKTLKSLSKLDYDKDKFEIIVIDDGSKDKTFEKAKEYAESHKHINIKVIRKENGGKHTAVNLALKHASGEFFGALDADSFVDRKALKRIILFFEDTDVWAVTPSMKIYKPTSFLQRVQSIEYLIGVFLRKVFAEMGSIHVTPGPFSFYRMSFFEKYGPYRKAHHTEDIELALRIQSHHGVIENAVDAYVYTMGLKNFKALYKQRIRWYYGFLKNILDYKELFGRKHGNLGLFILPSSFLSVGLVILSMFYAITILIQQWTIRISNWIAINFDIFKFNFKFDPFFIDTSSTMLLGVIAFSTSLIIILLAKRISEDKEPITLSYVFFLATYWVLFGFWWLVSIWYVIFTKDKMKWGHKSESNEPKEIIQ